MGKLVYSKFCSLISSIFDLLGIVSFFFSEALDDKSHRLIGEETNSEAMDRWRKENDC
jgi:hypothetical protein